MVRVSGWRWVGVILICVVMATASTAQVTFMTIVNFDGPNGALPVNVSLIQGTDGNFYGTTELGGASCGRGCGEVFKITPNGKLTRLYSFCRLAQCADGDQPEASLVQGIDGRFYGETLSGGSRPDGCGTVFAITAKGQLTTLHTFEGADGCGPQGGLLQAANGNFYGGTYDSIFEITPAGQFTSLYTFCSMANCADGSRPSAPLVQASDGSFYGTTGIGGAGPNCSSSLFPNGCGTIFKITPAGKLTTLYRFCALSNCADGMGPGALIQATNGNLYGATGNGGANCAPYGCGTVFEVSNNHLTTLYSFCNLTNCADGSSPSLLTQATDGNFYGTTQSGGIGDGTVFEITSAGTLTTLHSMCSETLCSDGSSPMGGLLQASNGVFYGTTYMGGTSNDGIVFSLDTGLAPFVSFIRNPAKVGQQFGILGYGLTGASGVVFNGISASFTAKSDTLLIATVPSGATTGYVTVLTATGTLTSNVPFHVIR